MKTLTELQRMAARDQTEGKRNSLFDEICQRDLLQEAVCTENFSFALELVRTQPRAAAVLLTLLSKQLVCLADLANDK